MPYYLPYRPKVRSGNKEGELIALCTGNGRDANLMWRIREGRYYLWLYKYKCIPYLRNLSDLNKPITQKDYNDGKPFVSSDVIQMLSMYDNIVELITKGSIDFNIIQQLLKWHFAIGFEQGEYIEVNDQNNPY